MSVKFFSTNSIKNNYVSYPAVPVEYLVVAGGGGAQTGVPNVYEGSGAGGGGYLTGTYTFPSRTPQTVTVGAGGPTTTVGSNSEFSSFLSFGGGRAPGGNGGSGGGNFGTGGLGTAGQGNNGGSGNNQGGSGGGAGAAGTGGSTNLNGGVGLSSSINGTATTRASGGANGKQGNGASGGANTGNGGAGGVSAGSPPGGSGGSGIVILAYPSTFPILNVGPGLTQAAGSPSTSIRSGYRVYTFTAGTGTVSFT